jgi:hypothetical protein
MEAHPAMALLFSYFPAEPKPAETTVLAWSLALGEHELADTMQAARILGEGMKFRAALAELTDCARECRAERLANSQPALGAGPKGTGLTFEEWAAADPETAARWQALHDRAAEPFPPMTRAEIEEEGQLTPKRTPTDISSGLCPGLGQVAVEVDGVLVCPACGSPLDEGCRPSSARGSKAASA